MSNPPHKPTMRSVPLTAEQIKQILSTVPRDFTWEAAARTVLGTTDPVPTNLYRDVVAKPWDDAPRLLLADWFDEYGDPGTGGGRRAEFIRVQIELENQRRGLDGYGRHKIPASFKNDARQDELEQRQAELFSDWRVRGAVPLEQAHPLDSHAVPPGHPEGRRPVLRTFRRTHVPVPGIHYGTGNTPGGCVEFSAALASRPGTGPVAGTAPRDPGDWGYGYRVDYHATELVPGRGNVPYVDDWDTPVPFLTVCWRRGFPDTVGGTGRWWLDHGQDAARCLPLSDFLPVGQGGKTMVQRLNVPDGYVCTFRPYVPWHQPGLWGWGEGTGYCGRVFDNGMWMDGWLGGPVLIPSVPLQHDYWMDPEDVNAPGTLPRPLTVDHVLRTVWETKLQAAYARSKVLVAWARVRSGLAPGDLDLTLSDDPQMAVGPKWRVTPELTSAASNARVVGV
jgi:uncharacterized protein (TIGR02996 family)